MSLGNRIKELRKKANLSQMDLANKLYVSDKTISSWEQNRTEPSFDFIFELSRILECQVTYILYGKEEKLDMETEIKIRLTEEEYKNINIRLEQNSTFIKETNQEDAYYEPKNHQFTKQKSINKWLRIGNRGNKSILNYKNWHDNKYCDEYAVELDTDTNMEKILFALGFERIAFVKKQRKTFMYQNKYEFSLDFVEKLGYFVEIEVKEYDMDVLQEYETLLKLAKEFNLNLNAMDKKGYPYYFIEKEL